MHDSPSLAVSEPCHTLKDILTPDRDKTVVVWETKRPILFLPPIPEDSDLSGQDANLHYLQSLLGTVDGFNKLQSPFWNWLRFHATDTQIQDIIDHITQHLPTANGNIATFNPTMSFCTGSHVNVTLLGSLSQARSAMLYLVPYEGKSKFPMQHVLTVLDHTLTHNEHYPSVASDTGTIKRSVKHLLMRALNRMHLQMEISDYEVAAALLNLPSILVTERFQYGNPLALQAFQHHLTSTLGDLFEADSSNRGVTNTSTPNDTLLHLSLNLQKLQKEEKTLPG